MINVNISETNDLIAICNNGHSGLCKKRVSQVLNEVGIRAVHKDKVILTADEIRRLKAYMMNAYGLKEAAFLKGEISGDRAEMSRMVENEKRSSEKVRSRRVRWRTLPKSVLMNDVSLPMGTIGETRVEDLTQLVKTGVILTENALVFEKFEDLNFPIPKDLSQYIVVFRGDPKNPQDVCEDFLKQSDLPVFVFPDFDPAGLGMAQKVPGFKGILWPGVDTLLHLFNQGEGNRSRYLTQVSQYKTVLDNASHPDILTVWNIIDKNGAGIMQEIFLETKKSS